MSRRPLRAPVLLDLFCGAGGAGEGYRRAGFQVVGVDLSRSALEHYRPGPAVLADALTFPLRGVDVVHASPPCQAYSVSTVGLRNSGKVYPDLVAAVRERLEAWGGPYVIENVPGAPVRADVVLCGCQFGLRVRRKRWFETSWPSFALMSPCYHPEPAITVAGTGTQTWYREHYGRNLSVAEAREAMGVDWSMPRTFLSQAVPPAYTEWVGGDAAATASPSASTGAGGAGTVAVHGRCPRRQGRHARGNGLSGGGRLMADERVRLPLCRCGDYRHHHRGDDCGGPCIFGPSGCDCRGYRFGRHEERDWPWPLPPFAEQVGETRTDLALRAVDLVRLAVDGQEHRPRLHCCDACGEHWPCWQEEARQFVEAWEAAN